MRSSRRRLVTTVVVCSMLMLFMAASLYWALNRQDVSVEPSGAVPRAGLVRDRHA
jgi:hypothetical protein